MLLKVTCMMGKLKTLMCIVKSFQPAFATLETSLVHKGLLKMSRSMTKRDDLCAQRRLGWACTSMQSDQSLLRAEWEAKYSSGLHADRKDWSDWSDAQADLSICWAHRSFCLFCRAWGSNHSNLLWLHWKLYQSVKDFWKCHLYARIPLLIY